VSNTITQKQPNICKLHHGLFALANSEGVVDLDAETIARRIFPNESVNVEMLLTKLELNGNLESANSRIKLVMPRTGCNQSATKAERFEREAWTEPHLTNAVKDTRKRTKLSKEAGLTGFVYPPSYSAFMKSWPHQPISRDQNKAAWREWQALDRSKSLPDISVLILALKTSPPGPRTWPGTWLKRRPWRKPHIPVKCLVCNDEKVVYGVRPDGTKGAVPCPKCSK
jgi:hypothetical protein